MVLNWSLTNSSTFVYLNSNRKWADWKPDIGQLKLKLKTSGFNKPITSPINIELSVTSRFQRIFTRLHLEGQLEIFTLPKRSFSTLILNVSFVTPFETTHCSLRLPRERESEGERARTWTIRSSTGHCFNLLILSAGGLKLRHNVLKFT
jgi:hypothetical protein